VKVFALGGLVIALAIGYVVYTQNLTTAGGTQVPPQQQIDVLDIRANLMTIGQAQRMYLAAHGTYGTLEQLTQDGPPAIPTENRGYVFNAVFDGARSFKVTATPIDPNKPGWPTLVIDETMTLRESSVVSR
jgi:hypothetical protein